ncbi:MAG TPA: tetratricopeptide repeat protein [Terriglobales bacterium]|nr:tetratricopeptide repeat protein [Terriglobales bacterium]
MTARTLSAFREISSERINVSVGDFAEENLEANSVSAWEGTNHQLSWTMREDSADLILDVCLVDARTGAVLWTQAYRTNQVRGDEIPAQLVEQIVRCIWLKVARLPKHNSLPQKKNGCASREAYLKGRYFWKQRSEECLRKAVGCFESAIRHDQHFALPYSGLADALTLLSFYEFVSPSEVMPSARRAALNAIAIDPTSAEAHVSLADVLLHFERDWQGADREYRCAIQCNPEYALGYHWYSNLLSAKGQHDAAHLAIANALEIDPLSIITLVWAGFTSYLARQFDSAILHYKNALELDPNFAWTHMYLAQALEQKGNFRAAHCEFDAALRLARGNHSVKAMQAHTHAIAGDKPSAREILRELKCASSSDRLPSYDIAATYAALAEPSRMTAWLRRACQERSMKLFSLPQDPRFDTFRCRSDFREILREIGLLPN